LSRAISGVEESYFEGAAINNGGLHVIGWIVVALGVTVVTLTLADHSLVDS
jgi:hypothetical protein